jgi:signal transduction histidine kinase
MAADSLMRADLPESQRQTVVRLARSAGRIKAMIRDVLDFARGRLGRGIPIKRQPCDLGRICAEEVAEMQQAHPTRAISCEVSDDLEGEWDPDRLELVLSNLIGNAIQHGRDPIRLVARSEGDEVIVSVHNQGKAIPAEMIPKVFEPFHRRAEDGAQGLGLGLYIVSEIVRAHGGTFSVSSSEGEGTTFMIRWPRWAPPAANLSTVALDAEDQAGANA